jgi:hypothetical protein
MKTFNVPQFYDEFCCYLKSTYFSFDKVFKLFTLSCLHLVICLRFEIKLESLKQVVTKQNSNNGWQTLNKQLKHWTMKTSNKSQSPKIALHKYSIVT